MTPKYLNSEVQPQYSFDSDVILAWFANQVAHEEGIEYVPSLYLKTTPAEFCEHIKDLMEKFQLELEEVRSKYASRIAYYKKEQLRRAKDL